MSCYLWDIYLSPEGHRYYPHAVQLSKLYIVCKKSIQLKYIARLSNKNNSIFLTETRKYKLYTRITFYDI